MPGSGGTAHAPKGARLIRWSLGLGLLSVVLAVLCLFAGAAWLDAARSSGSAACTGSSVSLFVENMGPIGGLFGVLACVSLIAAVIVAVAAPWNRTSRAVLVVLIAFMFLGALVIWWAFQALGTPWYCT